MDRFLTGEITVPDETKKTAEKTGNLVKRGGKWKNWRRRYFVLKNNFLYYFSEPKDSAPKGVILLDGAKLGNAEKETKRKFCFSMTVMKSFTHTTAWHNRTYFLQAETQSEMDSWMKLLRCASPGQRMPHTQKMTDELAKLFKACGKGDLVTVKSLMDANKFDLCAMDDEGNTPLHWAAVGGYVEIVKILIENGADVESKSRDGFTAMHTVAQEDHSDVLRLLLENGAKVDVPNKEDNHNTTLHYAACWGATECCKILLEKGANVDAKAQDDSTPLCFAAEKGHTIIAKMLIDHGAKLESKNDPEEKGGATPLLLAAHNGHIEVVKLLLEKSANILEKTIDGLNALHLAIRSGTDNPELIQLLINAGAEADGRTNNLDAPLHYACFMGYTKSAAILIQYGADLEAKGQDQSTPLHFAAREGKLEVVQFLLEKGASIDCLDSDGDSPLRCAELNEHHSTVQLIKSKMKGAGS
eukprot:TRINITY_DN2230_c0_g3_i2.p1 TRINITY_DN2230_c0_g3~~TRINITY_DN2230_c0_g3_i2.p1  ORF type:complete len:471 (-),score=123.49 TRINITY_DN2230_c0_g3_i2:43-1455(-)